MLALFNKFILNNIQKSEEKSLKNKKKSNNSNNWDSIISEICRLHTTIKVLNIDTEAAIKYQLVFDILCEQPHRLNKAPTVLELEKLGISQYRVEWLLEWFYNHPIYLMSLMICLAKGMNEDQSWNIAMNV